MNSGEYSLHYYCLIDDAGSLAKALQCMRGDNRFSALARQNFERNTPLHVAIERKSVKCLELFRRLFDNTLLHRGVDDELRVLLEIYNARGHTVLHEAVLHNEGELVAAILWFAEEMLIDVCSIEVLGRGDTILHLAVAQSLQAMEGLISRIIPNAKDYVNYAGATAYDVFGN